jgi:ubiquinone/menaquinone biosynthesis C-methylase UbiE
MIASESGSFEKRAIASASRVGRAAAALPVTAAVLAALVTAIAARGGVAAQSAERDATQRIIDALELHEGSTVAELGAGAGQRALAIARHVGPSGRVYTTELGEENLRKLRTAVEGGGVTNVTVVEARVDETNLPEQCCDAIYMEDVYHHFENPTAMNLSIFRSIKPGGRVAVVDFPPPPDKGEAARPEDRDQNGHHGVTPETVRAELEKAGFEWIKADWSDRRNFVAVLRRPATTAPEQGATVSGAAH